MGPEQAENTPKSSFDPTVLKLWLRRLPRAPRRTPGRRANGQKTQISSCNENPIHAHLPEICRRSPSGATIPLLELYERPDLFRRSKSEVARIIPVSSGPPWQAAIYGSRSPHNMSRSPHNRSRSPHNKSRSPHNSSRSPNNSSKSS